MPVQGEPVPVDEPGHVTDVGEGPGGHDGSDAVQVHQPGAASQDDGLEFGGGLLDLRFDRDQFGELFGGDPAAGLPGDVTRSDRGEHGLGLTGGDVAFRLSRQEFCQQRLQSVDGLAPATSQSFTAVGEHPQRLELTVQPQHPQSRGPHRNSGDRMGVVGVGLAVVASVEEPDPGGELRRDVHHLLAASSSRWASGRPAPLLPSTAQTRSGQALA